MTKVLFIDAKNVEVEVESRYPGLGLAYLVSSLREHFGRDFFEIKIIEMGSEQDVKRQILDFKPDVIGIKAVTQNFNLAKEYASFAKQNNISVIIGGVHISMLPQSLPKNVDLACLGEGELTIIEIFELFEKCKDFPKNELRKIKGIAFWDNEKLIITEPRPIIEKLDSIPMPARDLLAIGKHSYVFSSRGCAYRCTFCASSRFWNRIRVFSAEYVVREIKELYEKYNVRLISFFDDLFIIVPQRLKDITRLLKEEGLHGKIKFTGSCRSNLVNENIAGILKEMGVVSVGLGLESGSARILAYLKGTTTSVEDNKEAIRILKKYGIAVNASFIIGSPDETELEMMETYNFIKNSQLDLVDTYVLVPLPGTPVWDYAKEKGLVSSGMDWSRLSSNFQANDDPVVVSELYDKEQILRIYNKFGRLRLYLNLKNVWHSPFLVDLPRYMLKIFYGKFNYFIKKIKPKFLNFQ